jgi:hypothetical protein
MKEIRIRLQNALNDKKVENLFHTDLMNVFKVFGINYPDECESLTNHILLDLKNTKNLENFEKTTNLMFQNYKVLGIDLLKVISEKNKLYNEALFSEIKESIKSDLEEFFPKSIRSFIDEGYIHYSEKLDCVFAVNVLSHSVDLNGSLENITKLTNKRVVIIETVPFWTNVKEIEINKERTFLNDYFYHRIFCYKKDKTFVGNYKSPHAWDVLIAQKGFEMKSSLSKTFDFDNSPVNVKTKHYIGVYDKASDAIKSGCK